MPIIDGYEAARRLRTIPALALTVLIACSATVDEHKARQAGFDGWLIKPVGEPDRLPHHIEVPIRDGVERSGIERNARHLAGLPARPVTRKAITAGSRNRAFFHEPFSPMSRLTQ